jgi:type 1 glutamine amidotransferase
MAISKNRRQFLSQAATMGAATSLLGLSSLDVKGKELESGEPFRDLPSLEGRTVLFTFGGWNGHEPEKFRDHLVPWMKDSGADVKVFPSLDPYLDKDLMDNMDLVIQIFTMSSITNEQEKGLLAAIKENGTGIAGWHGGLCDAFRNNVEYQYMTGGQWVSHPGGVIDYEVNITDSSDAVTADLDDFPMTSEQYYMHIDPNVKVLATTTFQGEHDPWIKGCIIPVVWKKMYGKGRVFYTSLGHNLQHVIDSPNGMEIIKRGIRWASASKYEPEEEWLNAVYPKS